MTFYGSTQEKEPRKHPSKLPVSRNQPAGDGPQGGDGEGLMGATNSPPVTLAAPKYPQWEERRAQILYARQRLDRWRA